ncbi:MAG: HNH endonuclease [Proteobacteria bacterium]|nr:HNH endonuclease [Pseudomonadota bacterium]
MFVYKRSDKKYCSRDCELAKANRHERVKAAVIWAFTPGVRKVCVWCDREYIAYPKRASVSRYCCGECRDSVYAKSKSFYNRRRAHRLRSAYVEPVNVKVLHARDGGVCQICGGKVDIDLPYPHPKSASIDHIVPVSKDGEHSYKNTRLTHFMCNVYRGNDNTAQLRLF